MFFFCIWLYAVIAPAARIKVGSMLRSSTNSESLDSGHGPWKAFQDKFKSTVADLFLPKVQEVEYTLRPAVPVSALVIVGTDNNNLRSMYTFIYHALWYVELLMRNGIEREYIRLLLPYGFWSVTGGPDAIPLLRDVAHSYNDPDIIKAYVNRDQRLLINAVRRYGESTDPRAPRDTHGLREVLLPLTKNMVIVYGGHGVANAGFVLGPMYRPFTYLNMKDVFPIAAYSDLFVIVDCCYASGNFDSLSMNDRNSTDAALWLRRRVSDVKWLVSGMEGSPSGRVGAVASARLHSCPVGNAQGVHKGIGDFRRRAFTELVAEGLSKAQTDMTLASFFEWMRTLLPMTKANGSVTPTMFETKDKPLEYWTLSDFGLKHLKMIRVQPPGSYGHQGQILHQLHHGHQGSHGHHLKHIAGRTFLVNSSL